MPRDPAPGRFLSVGSKLALAIGVVLALLTAAIYGGLSRAARERMLAAKEQAARMAGELFLRSASTPVVFDDATGIQDTVALLAQDPQVLGVELWRVAGPGLVGARLAGRLRPGAGAAAPRWVDRGLIERHGDRIVLRDAVRDQDDRVAAVVAVQYSLAPENLAYAELRRRILMGAAGAGALLGLLLLIMTRRWITGPLGRLLRAVRQVEAGEHAELGAAFARDEVGRLAEAFGRMADAVARRERDISRRNQDMKRLMDNVAQGFLSVTREGALLPEHSAILESWFGPWRPGEPLWAYLGPRAPKASAWLAALWGNLTSDMLPLELALEQLPARMAVGERTFALSYRPIDAAEQPILVVISDVTPEVEQEEAKVGQNELVSLFQWLVKDQGGLLDFFADSEQRVRALTGGEVRDAVLLRRELHTLKGNSGLFGLSSLVSVCQALEGALEEGGDELSPEQREALGAAWRRVSERRRQLLGDDAQRRVVLEPEEHEALLDALARGAPRGDLEARVRSWSLEPAGRRLARIGEQARALARRLGKGEIAVAIDTGHLRLPEGALASFWAAFAHVVRNAVNHGLEAPEERVRAGKSAAGTIQLRAQLRGGRLLVEIEDDGRGIDWCKLRERARAAGLPADSRADLVEALFADGVSTAESVSETSGRGVGMSAVRGACDETGGKVRVQSEPGEGTRIQFIWPESVLGPEPAALPPPEPRPDRRRRRRPERGAAGLL